MRKTKITRFLLPALCAVFVAAAGVLFYQTSVFGKLETQKQASLDQITTFLESGDIEKFTNEEAIEAFNKEIKKSNAEIYGSFFNAEGHWVRSKPIATYKAPEGFNSISFSKEWDEEKLGLLREELLKNKHGKELEYLSEIRVYPAGDNEYLATHSMNEKRNSFKLNFPAVPKYFEVRFIRQVGLICLYGGDKNTTVESMAKSLSHEYGHHFTFYHMFEGNDLAKSEYAKLRKLPEKETVTSAIPDDDDYLENHHWYMFEIAAEDYVTLMGSPTVKRICEVKDNKQLLAGAKNPDVRVFSQCANVSPQENLMIPLANDVKGLTEYFHSFTDEKPAIPKLPKKEIKIDVKKGYNSYDLVGGKRTFTHYKVTWDAPYDDPDAVYTLIRFGEYEGSYYVMPVKTVHAGSSMTAYIGDVTRTSGNSVYYFQDDLTEGTQNFIVSVQLSDGTIYLSDPLEYKFS